MRLVIQCVVFSFAASLLAQPVEKVFGKDRVCISRPGTEAIALWKRIREGLEGKDGNAYAAQLKGAVFPKFPATVLAVKPRELLVSIADGKTPEVVVRLMAPWKGKPLLVGAELEFEGVGGEFVREPFRLMIDLDPAKLEVLERSNRAEGSIPLCYTMEEYGRVLAGEKVAPR